MPRITAAGRSLEVEHFGPAPDEAPTLVLLHEGLGSVSTWKDWPRQLADSGPWGVVAYSRAGYGNSDPIERPRRSDEARVIGRCRKGQARFWF